MSSINDNQPERNHEDVSGNAAREKIHELVTPEQNCFFCTNAPTGPSGGVRPMNVRKVDADGVLWFLSASDSHQNRELTADPSVRLFFQGSNHSDFLHLTGRASVSTDRAKIKDLWEPKLKTWFTEGVDDPRLTVIRVVPDGGYYWDTKHGNAVAFVKMLIGAATGTTLDDSIEGQVRV